MCNSLSFVREYIKINSIYNQSFYMTRVNLFLNLQYNEDGENCLFVSKTEIIEKIAVFRINV